MALSTEIDLPPSPPENGAWQAIGPGWAKLYGSLKEDGVSVENHDFNTEDSLDWGRSFHEDSVELCLNISGTANVRFGNKSRCDYTAKTFGFYGQGSSELRANRLKNDLHSFVTIEWSRTYLSQQLEGQEKHVHAGLRTWLSGKKTKPFIAPSAPMSSTDEHLCQVLRKPPVAAAAHKLWYQSKITESMARLFFVESDPKEFFCEKINRAGHERAERVITILKRNLVSPPDLEALGREVGCSPFYLSRTFSTMTGQTIPQYLRELRIRRAAELLRDGKYNVTEAALEVGYNSIGHFSTAFCHVTGCCPSLYLKAPHLAKAGF